MPSIYDDLERPPLHAEVLRRALVVPGSMWSEVTVVSQASSTNAVLTSLATRSDADGVVLIAEHQTAGRGRLDRTWTAPARSGLTMSVLVRPDDVAAARWPWLPLLGGLAVAASLRREAEVEATLKWPNDVVVGDRKVGGLLVERVETSWGPGAVIGIGLNVSLRTEDLPVPGATSLVLEGAATTDRSLLARAILRALEGLLTDWYRHSGRPEGGLRLAYQEACSTIGRWVRLEQSDGTSTTGEAVGIDDTGRLLLRTAAGQLAFSAGDVVHLRGRT